MSYPQPNITTFKAAGAISRGHAVKLSTDLAVVKGAANTDRVIGLALSAVTSDDATAGVPVEVALPGGGGKALLGENVVRGDDLVAHTDGTLVKPNAEGDQIVARALESGSSGELIPVLVYLATAHASQ